MECEFKLNDPPKLLLVCALAFGMIAFELQVWKIKATDHVYQKPFPNGENCSCVESHLLAELFWRF